MGGRVRASDLGIWVEQVGKPGVSRPRSAGVTYANLHSTPLLPGGEIRGQIRSG